MLAIVRNAVTRTAGLPLEVKDENIYIYIFDDIIGYNIVMNESRVYLLHIDRAMAYFDNLLKRMQSQFMYMWRTLNG